MISSEFSQSDRSPHKPVLLFRKNRSVVHEQPMRRLLADLGLLAWAGERSVRVLKPSDKLIRDLKALDKGGEENNDGQNDRA